MSSGRVELEVGCRQDIPGLGDYLGVPYDNYPRGLGRWISAWHRVRRNNLLQVDEHRQYVKSDSCQVFDRISA